MALDTIIHIKGTTITGNPLRRTDQVVVQGLNIDQLIALTGPSGLCESCPAGHMHGDVRGRKITTFGKMLGDSTEVAVLIGKSDDDAITVLLKVLGARAEIILVEDWADKVQGEYLDELSQDERTALIQEAMGDSLGDLLGLLVIRTEPNRGDMSDESDRDDIFELIEEE